MGGRGPRRGDGQCNCRSGHHECNTTVNMASRAPDWARLQPDLEQLGFDYPQFAKFAARFGAKKSAAAERGK